MLEPILVLCFQADCNGVVSLYLFIVEICQNLNDLISVLVSFGNMPNIFCLTIAANLTLINLSLARSSSHLSLMQIWEAASSGKK